MIELQIRLRTKEGDFFVRNENVTPTELELPIEDVTERLLMPAMAQLLAERRGARVCVCGKPKLITMKVCDWCRLPCAHPDVPRFDTNAWEFRCRHCDEVMRVDQWLKEHPQLKEL